MSKFSVKKPYTVLVMVLIIIMLGVVSLTRMQMDLLPQISLPYILVITTYPGASPEKVEAEVSKPLESALGKVTNVENVYSYSNENYSMVQLQFTDDTDMDSIMVKVNSAIDTVEAGLPEECGTPTLMELSVDMLATQYLAISKEGMDMDQLSAFVENNVTPSIERQKGVASITSLGLIEKSVQIELNQAKVDKLNDKILGIAEDAFDEAMEDLDEAREKLEDSEETMKESKQKLIDSEQDLVDGKQKLIDAQEELEDGKQKLIDGEKELADGEQELKDGKQKLEDAKNELADGKDELEKTKDDTYSQLAKVSKALEALETYRAQLLAQEATLKAVEAALEQMKTPEVQAQIDELKKGIKAIEDGLAQLDAGIEGLNTLKGLVDAELAKEDAQITAVSLGTLSFALKQAGADTTYLDGYVAKVVYEATDYATIRTILKGYSDGFATQLSELDKQKKDLNGKLAELNAALDGINEKFSQFETEKQSLELEIAVTKEIIKQYEKQLKKAGVDYTDIEKAKMQAAEGFGSADAQMAAGELTLESSEKQLEAAEDQLETARDQLKTGWEQLDDGQKQIDDGWESMAEGEKQLKDGWKQLEDGQKQIDDGWESYYDGLKQFDKQRKEALRQANADQLLSLSTLSTIVYAQNFEMPAGYIDDKDDNSWLLKIGDNYNSIEDLENMVLTNIDDIGDVKLKDVADITIIDNASTTYTKLNGKDAVILSVFKSSTAGTNEVSKACLKEIDRLQDKYEGLNILVLMDQGDYINLIVKNVLQNMLIGAVLAIIVLAIFLRDFMPTVVVAISIPLSVLTAIVAMYFSKLSLNMMSLSGMALGIGMLVDNSIVVIENIYRLRSRGVSAARAAVQGTKQVAGAVLASTLTTVCVFFPIVYTSGMTRDLMLPMSLTIIYTLLASLFIAMTVVPASAFTMLRNTKQKEHKIFDKIQDIYGNVLSFFLKVKIIPLAVAIGLLAISIWQVLRMGIVMIPEMTSSQIEASATFDEEKTDRETAYNEMNVWLSRAMEIDGVASVGAFAGDDSTLFMDTGSSDDNYTTYNIMIISENENAGSAEVNRIVDELNKAAEDLSMELEVSSGLGEMGSMLGSGLSISIYGNDETELLRISQDIMDMVDQVEGFTDITNGQEDADEALHLNINKDYAMSKGLSVAQIFQDIAGNMTSEAKAVSVNIDGTDMDIKVVDHMDPVTVENLMDYSFAVSVKDEDGDTVTEDIKLSEIATLEKQPGFNTIRRENMSNYMTVSAVTEEGYNVTLLTRELQPMIDAYELPDGYSISMGGESESVNEMVKQMTLMMLMGLAFIYFVMVAQFQSLLSPFIILFTVPLAFTGGLIALWITGEQLSVMSLFGMVILLGTVVNNGIVFVDYTNQLRIGGLSRHDALIATGKTRMRPILMTAMTTILAESAMIFGDDMASQMGKGMALVIAGGLLYATFMTLFIIPVMYDILFKKQPLNIDTGSEDLDDVPDDAKEYMEQMLANKE